MIYLHNFTGVYEKQDFYKKFSYKMLNNKDLSGVRGYMDEEAKEYLLDMIENETDISSIHFLDSGNYHHLSKLYLSKINTEFNLVVYDNHTDMQFSAFGNILSCGSWIADSYESLVNLNKIYLIGVSKDYIKDCVFINDERIVFADSICEMTDISNLPIYVSVDKDVLSNKEFISDWDQGIMTLDKLMNELSHLVDNCELLGADICGEPLSDDDINICLSNNINEELLNIFVDILY